MTTFIAGNKRQLYFGTQSAKGSAQGTPTVCLRVSDFSPNDVRQEIQLSETDALSQDGTDVVVGVEPGFSFKAYLRPSEVDFFASALLGHNVDSGSSPNYTHTADADDTQPYLTMFEVEPSVLCNEYIDCRVTSMTVTGGVGEALEVTVTCEALSFAAGASAPTSPAPANELPYVYPEVTVTKGGAAPGTFQQFEITITRNSTRAQGDSGMTSIDCVAGKFSVTGTITKYQQDDDDQRAVDTGSSSGTAPTTTVFSETLVILVARSANVRVTFDMDSVAWKGRQSAVRTDGTPLLEVMGFRTLPQATLAGTLQVISKNQKATPDS